ncbi:metallophosphoesterase [Actinorugispora endophytica]|uniref:3',5'-cyclic AMP phosphodiesterase CpdA n=1 Tax=Actinorugispora endophytica TaxID=1605990 RepID=A0A4R6UUM1_9ACTN|nr:metallophosphoesterase [Actinorugispora endophytica]TDQ47184.1 3',5'-cyclic AMP phosphodiesterase CpdA [Actinorugispora endophytica]
MIVVAHLSDLHIDGEERSRSRTERVADHLRGLSRPADAVLVTGDVADSGRPRDYALAAELLAGQKAPVLFCPGNHDDRAALRAGLLGGSGDAPVHQAHHVAGALFLLMDSTIPGRDEGSLGPRDLEWLRDRLSASPAGTPVLLALHHPPATVGNPPVDELRLRDSGPLAEVLADFPDVVAVLVGHAHTAMATTFAGRPLLGAPGVVSTSRLPWEPSDTDAPPGLAFHLLHDDRRLTSHFRFLTAPNPA